MARDLGLPVPPAFVITTETCRRFLADGWPAGLDDELRERMRGLEARLGRRFGDPADPLLVSVRSGAPVSMPGMMDTILDLGLNDATTAGLARVTGDEAFARVVPRALRVELPLDRRRRGRAGRPVGAAAAGAIEAVFRSWQSDRARAYRRKEGIPDDLGTAVTVQAMVFGNRGPDSATGVLFTRDPATGEPALYGDVLFGAQGEDVVAGTHRTEPIAVLDDRLPAVAAELRGGRRRASSATSATCATSSSRSSRAGSGCSRSGSASEARGGPADRRRHGRGPGLPADAGPRPSSGSRSLLADPPTIASARSDVRPAAAHGPARVAGDGQRRDRHRPRGGPGGRGRRRAGDPRPRRDLARRCPRHGGGGRHPHLAGRAREPRRGRRPRLGDPGRRRGGRPRASRTAGSRSATGRSRPATSSRSTADRRGVRGRRSRARPRSSPRSARSSAWAAELGIEIAAARPARRTRPRSAGASWRPARRARTVTADRCLQVIAIKGFAQPGAIAEAVLADAGRRRADPRPAGDRRARRELGRRLQADRRRDGPGGRPPRRGPRRLGRRRGRRRPRRLPRPRPRGEGHGHRVAAPRRHGAGRQRPRRRRTTTRRSSTGSRPWMPTRRRGSRPLGAGLRRLGRLRRRDSPARSPGRGPATAGSSPHPASTATTASGSSSTRT